MAETVKRNADAIPDMREDSREQIEKCLNCRWSRCVDCVTRISTAEPKVKRKGRPVIAYGDGKETRYESIHAAGRAIQQTPSSISQALKKGNKCQGLNWRYE